MMMCLKKLVPVPEKTKERMGWVKKNLVTSSKFLGGTVLMNYGVF
jgi:hypothetical protein